MNNDIKPPRGPFYQHGLILIPARISNYMLSKVQDEIIYPFPNFNGCTRVLERISNFTPQGPHVIMDVIV